MRRHASTTSEQELVPKVALATRCRKRRIGRAESQAKACTFVPTRDTAHVVARGRARAATVDLHTAPKVDQAPVQDQHLDPT